MEVYSSSDGACGATDPGAPMGLSRTPGGASDARHILAPLVPDFSSRPFQVYCGDALETIRRLNAGGIQFDCVVTSPPYYNLRRYGEDAREIGRETDVDSFVRCLAGVFKEIPLRPWASVWVNIADKRGPKKALLGVPERFQLAMQDAGFFLIDKVVWAKEVILVGGSNIGHSMIEPANYRLNGNGWEVLYRFLVNPERAWSDVSAVRIPRDREHFFHSGTSEPIHQHPYSMRMRCATSIEGRSLGNVWFIGNSRGGKGHFAAFPAELVERPIAMTCPEWLVDDGGEIRPRVRRVEATVYSEGTGRSKRSLGQYSLLHHQCQENNGCAEDEAAQRDAVRRASRMDFARSYTPRYPKTVGWSHMDKPIFGPGIVLDPFGGTGTTGQVSVLLGRRFVGIDLYREYADRMSKRCEEAFESLGQACAPEPPACKRATLSRRTHTREREPARCPPDPHLAGNSNQRLPFSSMILQRPNLF